LTRLFMGRS